MVSVMHVRSTSGCTTQSFRPVFLPTVDGVWLVGLDRHLQEEQEKGHLEKVLGSEALQDRISTLTTNESMDLYCSYFSKVCDSAGEDLLLCDTSALRLYSSRKSTTCNFLLLLRRCPRTVQRKELMEHRPTQRVPRTGFKTTLTEMDPNTLSWSTKTFSPARSTR